MTVVQPDCDGVDAIRSDGGLVHIRTVTSDDLAENADMIQVFHDIGFDTEMTRERGTIRVAFDLDPADRMITAISDRERAADAASLRPLLAPRSIAVTGASNRAGSVGNQVL